MKSIIPILLASICLFLNIEGAFGYTRTSNDRLDTNGVLLDWMNISYKRFGLDSMKDQIYSNQIDIWIEVDTTFIIDARDQKINISNDSIKHSFTEYYQKYITSPKHGGDPNEAKLSFVVNGLGQVKAIHVLENVRNACSPDWIIHLEPGYVFNQLNINDSSFSAEYIVTFTDISYCICEIEEKAEKRKRKGRKKR